MLQHIRAEGSTPTHRTVAMTHLEQDAMLLVLQSEHEQQIAQMSELRRQRSAVFRQQIRDKNAIGGQSHQEDTSSIPRSSSYESAAELERVSHKFEARVFCK